MLVDLRRVRRDSRVSAHGPGQFAGPDPNLICVHHWFSLAFGSCVCGMTPRLFRSLCILAGDHVSSSILVILPPPSAARSTRRWPALRAGLVLTSERPRWSAANPAPRSMRAFLTRLQDPRPRCSRWARCARATARLQRRKRSGCGRRGPRPRSTRSSGPSSSTRGTNRWSTSSCSGSTT